MNKPKTLSVAQSHSLLASLLRSEGTTKQFRKAIRNYAIAMLLLETGLRVSECCGLIVEDLWYFEGTVEILTVRPDIAKNHKERQIPVSSRLNIVISQMEQNFWRPDSAGPSGFAFYSVNPNTGLTTRSVERMISAAGKKVLNIDVTPHTFRHTFATRVLRKTNIRVVQSLLGHDNIQSTQIYTHPGTDELKAAIESSQ